MLVELTSVKLGMLRLGNHKNMVDVPRAASGDPRPPCNSVAKGVENELGSHRRKLEGA